MDKSTIFPSIKHLLYLHLFGVEARFPFANLLMCLVKKTVQLCKAQHNVCDHTGWWANSPHHGFNPVEPGSWWTRSKINSY